MYCSVGLVLLCFRWIWYQLENGETVIAPVYFNVNGGYINHRLGLVVCFAALCLALAG